MPFYQMSPKIFLLARMKNAFVILNMLSCLLSLDLTTEAGRTTFASLMGLQEGFAGMMSAAQQATGITSDSLKQIFDNFLKTGADVGQAFGERSEEHTAELQSPLN